MVGCLVLALCAAVVGVLVIPKNSSIQAEHGENLRKAQANLASEKTRYSPESLGHSHSAKAALFAAEMKVSLVESRYRHDKASLPKVQLQGWMAIAALWVTVCLLLGLAGWFSQ